MACPLAGVGWADLSEPEGDGAPRTFACQAEGYPPQATGPFPPRIYAGFSTVDLCGH
jgi:hypothetical protein